MFYRLDECVGWIPKSLRDGNKNEGKDKFWVDIWEAWWACLFFEREIWGDDVEDLVSFLKRMIELKYWGLVEKYSTNRRVDQGVWIDHNVNIDNVQQVPVREVQQMIMIFVVGWDLRGTTKKMIF